MISVSEIAPEPKSHADLHARLREVRGRVSTRADGPRSFRRAQRIVTAPLARSYSVARVRPEVDTGPAAETVQVWVPEAGGFVRGTREAVAAWGKPLEAALGSNHTVEACRVMVWGEAEKLGARTIEAVSAGPHRRSPKGACVAPVLMRIIYARPDGLEVKEAIMTCIMNRQNRMVTAFMRS